MTDTTSLPTPPDARPLRADARRNRERVIKAARAVFAEYGREAQMDDVARRANVGVGTVYRHFPTKEALFAALVEDKFLRLLAIVREHAGAEDPGEAFYAILWRFADMMAEDRTLHDVLRDYPHEEHARAVGLFDEMATVIDRAKAAAAVREDFRPDDLPVVMCGAGSAMQMAGCDHERFRRYFAMVLDGLRPAAA